MLEMLHQQFHKKQVTDTCCWPN